MMELLLPPPAHPVQSTEYSAAIFVQDNRLSTRYQINNPISSYHVLKNLTAGDIIKIRQLGHLRVESVTTYIRYGRPKDGVSTKTYVVTVDCAFKTKSAAYLYRMKQGRWK